MTASEASAARPWSVSAEGVILSVRLTARAARDAVEGVVELADGRPILAARVRAVPENGKANTALIGVLAELLGVPVSRIALVEGATARVKRLAIRGDATILAETLERFIRI